MFLTFLLLLTIQTEIVYQISQPPFIHCLHECSFGYEIDEFWLFQ